MRFDFEHTSPHSEVIFAYERLSMDANLVILHAKHEKEQGKIINSSVHVPL